MCDSESIPSPAVLELLGLKASHAEECSTKNETTIITNSFKFPPPPSVKSTEIASESSDLTDCEENSDSMTEGVERLRIRSRLRNHKTGKGGNSIPLGIFWDIENCQIPKGCSALDLVTTIRSRFLTGRREADFVVVCDVRKEAAHHLQELNDAQVSLIHVCCTQKNAADEKLRQCMRRFGELHHAPAALLLISGDINFASDLSDFRHRKNMEVILVHKNNTSSALIACANSHYNFTEVTAPLPRTPKVSRSEESESDRSACELEVVGLPQEAHERLARRLRRLADNCGGRVIRVHPPTALLRFATPDLASRAMKRMDGEDVFGHKIGMRAVRAPSSAPPAAYSSDEGYSTAPNWPPNPPNFPPHVPIRETGGGNLCGALAQAPPHSAPPYTPAKTDWVPSTLPPHPFCLPPPPSPALLFPPPPPSAPRKILGAHGGNTSINLDQSGSSGQSGSDDLQSSFGHYREGTNYQQHCHHRSVSPWNSSSVSEQSSEGEALETPVELTVSNLPPAYESRTLREMLTKLFSEHVAVSRVTVRMAADGPLASVMVRSESDARLAIARLHRRRLDSRWGGRRLEMSIGRVSPSPDVEMLRVRLQRLLRETPGCTLPLLRLRDSYAARHGTALTSSDLARVKDTVVVGEGFGRQVRLLDTNPSPMSALCARAGDAEEAAWICRTHAAPLTPGSDSGAARTLVPVYMEVHTLAERTHYLLRTHGGVLPLLSYTDCYANRYGAIEVDAIRGVSLELLLRLVPGVILHELPSRHIAWSTGYLASNGENSDFGVGTPSPALGEKEAGCVVAPPLAPLLGLLERELVDLLRTAPRCTIPFSRFIPAYHHHFGRQCRVADYGFTKLPELLSALSSTVAVLGSGCARVITLSPVAQTRRWTGDLLRLLRAQPARAAHVSDLPHLYNTLFSRPFLPADYGVCTIQELVGRLSPHSVLVSSTGVLSLPRRIPSNEERARTVAFAAHAMELLAHTPNLRMEFSRFVPAYHTHFGRQCRVAHYGCTKLVELFELIPEAVCVSVNSSGERCVKLARGPATAVMAQRMASMAPITLASWPDVYAAKYGAPPLADILEADSLEGLVYAAGGKLVERQGCLVVEMCSLGSASVVGTEWVLSALCACAALSGERSITAHGSTYEDFCVNYARVAHDSVERPPLATLVHERVVSSEAGYITLSPRWRAVWHVVELLRGRSLTTQQLQQEYFEMYRRPLPHYDLGYSNLEQWLHSVCELFVLEGGMWGLCAGLRVPPSLGLNNQEGSCLDTPPGEKGSRVFETPPQPLWSSPPACTLPAPSALLAALQQTHQPQQHKRRTRLAAQFGSPQLTE